MAFSSGPPVWARCVWTARNACLQQDETTDSYLGRGKPSFTWFPSACHVSCRACLAPASVKARQAPLWCLVEAQSLQDTLPVQGLQDLPPPWSSQLIVWMMAVSQRMVDMWEARCSCRETLQQAEGKGNSFSKHKKADASVMLQVRDSDAPAVIMQSFPKQTNADRISR